MSIYAIKTGAGEGYKDGRRLERDGDIEAAANVYGQLLKNTPRNLQAIQRLIIIYRKLKDVKQEIRYIDAAIKLQLQYYATGKKADKATASISNKLNKLLGHTDSKGKPLYIPEEIRKLELRKQRLLAKTKK
jgi:hypothetical protein